MTFNTGLHLRPKKLKQENNVLIYFTELVTGNKLAINPKYVTGVFVANDEDHKGKTVISLLNGSFLVAESQIAAVGMIQGQLQ